MSRGKVLVLPGNNALATRFIKMGLYNWYADIPPAAIAAFRRFVMTSVAVRRVRARTHTQGKPG